MKKKVYDNPIVTEVSPLTVFYTAEDYHQDYYENNMNEPYCRMVIQPNWKNLKRYLPIN
jgi:peptide methionine sulfoxide reductase MsrA